MIKLVGLGLIIPAGFFLYRAITSPPIRLGKSVQLMPLYGVLFFITVVAILVLFIWSPTTAVYVHGVPEDVSSYNLLADRLRKEYMINALDTYGKKNGAIEAVSCNYTALKLFATRIKEELNLLVAIHRSNRCGEESAIANFLHARIDLYLR